MRVHLVREGQRTSISVDDQLMFYLRKRLFPKSRSSEKTQGTDARLWIQQLVDAAGDLLPSSGISQWVQARIVDAITDPGLKDDAKRAEEAELEARVRALVARRRAEWEAREAHRTALIAQRESHESLAKRIAKRTPHYKQPPSRVGPP